MDEKNEPNSVKWLSIAAGTTFLIGVAGLLALMSHEAWAAQPIHPPKHPGFTAGKKSFQNPFGNAGDNKAGNDDSDDLDFGDDNSTPPSKPSATNTDSTQTNAASGAPTGPGISMGGQPNGGIISKNTAPFLKLNNDTGEGSNALVTDFNFPDASIMDIAKTLGRLTGKNFIFDKNVKGRISIISNSPVTVGDAWRAFLTALDMTGYAIIPSGKYLRIALSRDARDKQLPTYAGSYSPNTDALVTRIFSLKYINSDEVARTFRSFMPANSRIMAYPETNTVIVTDTGANINKLAKMLEILDVEGYDAGIEVIPVKYASASDLAKLIDQLLPGTGNAMRPGMPPRFGAYGAFNARRTKEGGVIDTIIADERTNSLIVHANNKGAEQVRQLVAKLDQKVPAPVGGGRVHVVYLQFADATAIATTLGKLTQQMVGAGFHPTGPGTGTNPMAASLFQGSIKVAADKATNALVVTASPTDFITLQRVINRLDIPRDEVYVETVLMEVAMNHSRNFATNVISPASGIFSVPSQDIFNLIQNPLSANGAVLGFRSGGNQTITLPNGQQQTISGVQGLITAIETNTNSNVLATPQIIALDNTEATFESSENIPVLTSTAVPNAGIAQTVTNQRVALSLKIKPSINKLSNFVKLDVEIKNGDIENRQLPQAVANQAFATLDRTAKTTVVVADSDTVVIGGLIRDKVDDTVAKIPVLGDIPILGWLFKSVQHSIVKSNLLVFLTPHIVRQYAKVRAILDRKLKERDEFIEKNEGGNDPLRHYRNDIIRSLPDIKKITSYKPQRTVTIDDGQPAAVEATPGNPFTGGNAPDDSSGTATTKGGTESGSQTTPPPPPPAQ